MHAVECANVVLIHKSDITYWNVAGVITVSHGSAYTVVRVTQQVNGK